MKTETMVVTDLQQEEHEAQPKHLALNFSEGSLYQAYPPPAMATTAASMGREVGIFFTFYGLDIVLKERIPKLSVSPIGTPAMPPPIKNVPIHMPTMVEALPWDEVGSHQADEELRDRGPTRFRYPGCST